MAHIEKLFNYRPKGNEITLNDGTTKINIMVLREGPRGIIAMVRQSGPIVLWDKENAEAHHNDTEEQFIERLKEVYGQEVLGL